MGATERQRLAVLYSQLLVFANAAQQRGLDKATDAQEALHFAEVQALSQVLARKLQADASKVSSDEIQKYYHEHPKQFEEGNLLRLYVPRGQQADGKSIKEEQAQAEMKKLRDRAAQGDSFETLQRQAYSDLGLTSTPPATELKRVRREGLSSAMSSVFDLQLSALSEPISEPNGLYVLQMTSKRVLSVQEATPGIVSQLQNRRVQQALEEISASTKSTFNADYFGGVPKTASTNPDAAPDLSALRESAGSNGQSASGKSTAPK
jgi:DNA polymerase III gamma/tau subunit